MNENKKISKENYEQLWEEYYDKVYGYFFKRVTNKTDVEDLSIEVMSKFFDYILKKDTPNPNALIWKISSCHLVNFIRNKKKQINYTSVEEFFVNANHEMETTYCERFDFDINNLKLCVNKVLNDTQLKVFSLSIFEDLKTKEIATQLNLSIDNVRQIMSRSVSKIKLECIKKFMS